MLVMNECVCDELMILMWLIMCMMCVMLELSKGREENIEIKRGFQDPSAQRFYLGAQRFGKIFAIRSAVV